MSPEDFQYLADFLKTESGLVLSTDKMYLVESRLLPVARKHGLTGLDELVATLRSKRDPRLNTEVVEAMTTNESFFFRDVKPFESFVDAVLPAVVEARREKGASKIRIWSAACSSGQEPYTIAMILAENPDLLDGMTTEIVATDLSSEILTKAKQGIYTQFEAQRGMPIQLLMKYFEQVGEHWQINENMRRMVKFDQANLLTDLSRFGIFDIVFCRNVLIYFDTERKADVLARIRRQMANDGFLYLGGAETVIGVSDAFKTVSGSRGVYTISDGTSASPVRSAAAPLAKSA